MKKLFHFFSLFGLCIASVIFAFVLFGEITIPDSIQLLENEEIHVNGIYSLKSSQEGENDASAASVASVSSETPGSYTVEVSVFNTIPVKSSTVTVSKRQYVVPSGDIFGVKIYTDGVLIVGMDDVFTASGAVNPAKDAGLEIGDAILAVDGKTVDTTEALTEALHSGAEQVRMQVRRGSETFETVLTLGLSENDGSLKAGLWVRDSTAGVGTMTFYDPETGVFGGLGHAICDLDTGTVMPLKSGVAVETVISGCYKGSAGVTGELCGVFQEKTLGELYANCDAGVYGCLAEFDTSAVSLPVATKNEVKTGYAQIISTVDDSGPHYYDVQIVKVYPNSDENGKNMIVEVTDEDLIAKTGGIIQGMSGSPIIQDGMLVGAVTHVFVNNALQGYGIFAETMLKESQSVETAELEQEARAQVA